MARKNFGITMDEDLLKVLDRITGSRSRSDVIEVAVRRYIQKVLGQEAVDE